MAILPDRSELTSPADGDLYVTTDVSDTTDAGTGTDKKITWSNIKSTLETYFDTVYSAIGASSVSTSARMGWVFPDSNIDPSADITGEKWHTLSAIWYQVDSSGDLEKRDDSSYGSNFYYTAANAETIRENCTVALVNVSCGNAADMNDLCSSATKRDDAVTELISFCEDNNFDGVDLDWEDFSNWTATHYTNFQIFIRELGTALHDKGLILSVEVPPIWNTAANTESGTGDAWDVANSNGYYELSYPDFNDLPVDQLVIMVYDYQYDYSAGEPNQPLKWMEETLEFARNNINENKIKIVCGVPSAGYSGATGGYSITGRTYDYLAAQTGFGGASRDSDSGELIWANAGTSYAACDDTCVQTKVDRAAKVGIYNYAVWHVGDNEYGGDSYTHKAYDKSIVAESRPQKRTGTATSSATPSINTDAVDFYSLTAQAAAITSFTTNLTGTPKEGQTLWIAITGTAARAITWGSSFEASTVALPTTTVTTNRLDVGFVYNTATSKWRCIASG